MEFLGWKLINTPNLTSKKQVIQFLYLDYFTPPNPMKRRLMLLRRCSQYLLWIFTLALLKEICDQRLEVTVHWKKKTAQACGNYSTAALSKNFLMKMVFYIDLPFSVSILRIGTVLRYSFNSNLLDYSPYIVCYLSCFPASCWNIYP